MSERGCGCPSNAMLLPGPAGNPVCTCCLDAAEKVRDYIIGRVQSHMGVAGMMGTTAAYHAKAAFGETIHDLRQINDKRLREIIAPKGEGK